MSLKLLFVGDIHLGKRPSRIPEEIQEDIRLLGPAQVWKNTVEFAVSNGVHAVVLAGDVVEKENDFFEAYRELQNGVEKLIAHNIRIIGVAGNHDVKVLPRLADQLDHFELLGRGGQWQHTEVKNGQEKVRLWGWSFFENTVLDNPVHQLPYDAKEGCTLILF